MLAHTAGLKITEVPVVWHHVTGSKVSPFKDGWQMFVDIWKIGRKLKEYRGAVKCKIFL